MSNGKQTKFEHQTPWVIYLSFTVFAVLFTSMGTVMFYLLVVAMSELLAWAVTHDANVHFLGKGYNE